MTEPRPSYDVIVRGHACNGARSPCQGSRAIVVRAYDEHDDEQRVRVVEVHEDVRQVWAFTSSYYSRYRAVDLGIWPTNRWLMHGVTDELVRRGRRRQ